MTKEIDYERPWVILAMTDDASAKMLAKMLAKRGARVETVETAEDALTKARRQPTAAIMTKLKKDMAEEIQGLVNHGIPIYAINFGTDHDAAAAKEATDKGIKEVFEMKDFESYSDTWLSQLRGRGNRFAEDAPEHVGTMIVGESAYLVEELLEFPESTGSTKKDKELEDSEKLIFSVAKDSKLGQESASQSETEEKADDILATVNRQVRYLLHQHEIEIERRVGKMLMESLVGQEVKIHEIASAIAAQQAEEIYEVVAEAISQVSLSSSGVTAGDERESPQEILARKRDDQKTARPKWINPVVQYAVIFVGAIAVSAGVIAMILKFLHDG